MPVTCTKNVRLRARDLELFETLLERRVETLGHLHRVVFPDNARKTARNRLVRLRQAGYVERLAMEDLPADLLASGDFNHPQASVYRLTARGIAALRLRHRAGAQLRGGPGPGHLSEASIPHQLAVNRVGDWLGARLIGEHQIEGAGKDRRHRPDAAYLAAPDDQGRDLILVEVDLGNYTRARILGKVATFLTNDNARAALIVTPDQDRAAKVAAWIRQAHGDGVMRRLKVLTFDEVRDARLLDPDLAPAGAQPTRSARA